MKTCLISGIASFDHSPIAAELVGTSLIYNNLLSLVFRTSFTISSIFFLNFSSFGKKKIPVAYLPSLGRSMLRFLNSFLINLSGICNVIPAPSPVSGSHPQAPLCSKFTKTSNESFTILFDFFPFMFATTPTPHASLFIWYVHKPSLESLFKFSNFSNLWFILKKNI